MPIKAWWQFFEERQDEPTFQLSPTDHLASSINAVYLKDRLRDIQDFE
jgi:hypothetical protein